MKTNTSELNQQKGFDKGYKWLHWAMSVLILLMLFALIGFNDGLSDQERAEMLVGHSSIGSIISLLLVIRIFKRFVKKDPIPTQNIAAWQKRAAKVVQMGLYTCMVLVPISGYLTARAHELPVMVFGSFHLNGGIQGVYNAETFLSFRALHEFAIGTLIVLIVLHIGAALYHKFVKKDLVMATMTGLKNK